MTDCVSCSYREVIGVDNLHVAYADDIAVVVGDLWQIGPSICKLFDLAGLVNI